jgi:hypothetical protein
VSGGNPGGDGTPSYFGRADFVATAGHAIVDDGLTSCFVAGDHPLGGSWDNWDRRDTDVCSAEDGVQQSDISGGGR